MRRALALLAAIILFGGAWGAVNADPGDLDQTFSGDGLVIVSEILPAGQGETFLAMALQSDGKLVLVGSCRNPTALVMNHCLARLTTDGSLDPNFDGDGKVWRQSNVDDQPRAVAMQGDKILVAGACFVVTQDFCIVRYNANGSVDTGWGTNGKLTTDVFNREDSATQIIIQPDDKILLGGYCDGPVDREFCFVRYDAGGNLDLTFNSTGIKSLGIGANDGVWSMALQPDHKILAAGNCNSIGDLCVLRLTENGALDGGFGTNGIDHVSMGSSPPGEFPNAIAVQDDGKIVIGGACSYVTLEFCLARLNSNGSFDTTLDQDGKLHTNILEDYDSLQALLLQPGGRILAAGSCHDGSRPYFCLVRYRSDGSLDPTFGDAGKLVTQVAAFRDIAISAISLGDHRVVVGGTCAVGAPTRLCAARYEYVDSDGDAIEDGSDNCPKVGNLGQENHDNDALGDACDTDDDNDGNPDVTDSCDFDPDDAFNDPCNHDEDSDGHLDVVDNCPSIANANQANNDGDSAGDLCDPDDDNDTVLDGSDNCVFVSNVNQANNDGDAVGNLCDPDDDNDTVLDGADNCVFISNQNQANNDGDASGDLCDPDDDNDTVLDGADNCVFISNQNQANNDGDASGDLCDPDDDNDTVLDGADNCVFISNQNQANNDGDALGDLCDPDDDNDTVLDGADNCVFISNQNQANNDGDASGDLCDPDDDNDTVLDGADNCVFISNQNQANNDGDASGDLCDPDDDNDTVLDGADNCVFISNQNQANNDGDALGDLCDPDDDNDTVLDGADNCVFISNQNQANNDGDASGDLCDPDDDNDGYSDPQELGLDPPQDPLTFCAIMRADVDHNGSVSILDLAVVAAQFLQPIGPDNQRLNQDGDGFIGILDLAAMAAHFLEPVLNCPGRPPVILVAQNIAFDQTTITLPRGAPITVKVDNRDAGINHGFRVQKPGMPILVLADSVTPNCSGPCMTESTFVIPANTFDSLQFRCTVHSGMIGTIILTD